MSRKKMAAVGILLCGAFVVLLIVDEASRQQQGALATKPPMKPASPQEFQEAESRRQEHQKALGRFQEAQKAAEKRKQIEFAKRWNWQEPRGELQTKRWRMIERMMSEGIFTKVSYSAGGLPHAFTGGRWPFLTVDDKQTFSGVVLAYFLAIDPNSNILILHDGFSGKRIGTLDVSGLRLD